MRDNSSTGSGLRRAAIGSVACLLVLTLAFASDRRLRADHSYRAVGLMDALAKASVSAAGIAPGGTITQGSVPAALMLPVLNFRGDSDVCRSWVAVQNVGYAATKTVLVVWGAAAPACSGPLKAECSGLMAPGASWYYLGPQVPTGSSSGILYSFDPRPLSELGVPYVGDLAADYMCERLFFGTVGNCAAFRDFHAAYMSGGMFEDEIDLSVVRGQRVVATVMRHCPGADNPGVVVSSTYGAVPLVPASAGPVAGDLYAAYAYPIDGIPAPSGPFVNVQSMSTEDNAVVVETAELGDSVLTWYPCEQRTLYLGEAAHVDLAGCLALDTWYAVRAVGTGPLAVTVDRIRGDTMASWEGVGSGSAVNAAGAPEALDPSEALGPIVPLGPGWESHLAVHVPGTAEVSVSALWTHEGGRQHQEVRSVCGGCIAEFVPPTSDQADRAWVKVSALSGAAGTRIDAAVVSVSSTSPLEEAFGYILGRTGVGEHVAPLFIADLPGTGMTTELTLVNSPSGGRADFAVSANVTGDPSDVICASVESGQSTSLPVAPSPLLTGTLGAALIHASAEAGTASTAVGVRTVTGTSADSPIQGDETSVTLAPALASVPEGATPCEDYEPPLRPDPVAELERENAIRSAIRMPVINYLSRADVCQDNIEITNRGSEPAIAVLVTWGEAGFCAPQCAGPLAASCTGLIGPGTTWTVSGTSLTGAAAGVVYGARAITLDEAGAEPGGTEMAAEQLCSTLLYEAVGDCDDTRRFQLEWASGGAFGGIPLGPLAYSQLSVVVKRSCPLDRPDETVEFQYAGVAEDRFDPFVDKEGRFVQSIVPAEVDESESTVVYIQNGGARCTEVVLTFHLYGDWDSRSRCNVHTLASGESYALNLGDCVGDWVGAVVLESQEPLAVVAESNFSGPRVAYGRNRSNPYDLDGDANVDTADVAALERAMGSVPGDGGWNELADLNADRLVDDTDRRILMDNLLDPDGATATPTTQPAPTAAVFLPFAMWVPPR